jgi:hypothetical protein
MGRTLSTITPLVDRFLATLELLSHGGFYTEMDSGLSAAVDREIVLWNAIAPPGSQLRRTGSLSFTTTELQTIIQEMHAIVAPELARFVRSVAHLDGLEPNSSVNGAMNAALNLTDVASLNARTWIKDFIQRINSQYAQSIPGLELQYGKSAVAYKRKLLDAAESFQRSMHPKSDAKIYARTHGRVNPGEVNSPSMQVINTDAAIGSTLENFRVLNLPAFMVPLGTWCRKFLTPDGVAQGLLNAPLPAGMRYVVRVFNNSLDHIASGIYALSPDSTKYVVIGGVKKRLLRHEFGLWTVSANPTISIVDANNVATSFLGEIEVVAVLIDDARNVQWVIGEDTIGVSQSAETIQYLGKTTAGIYTWGESKTWEIGMQVLFTQPTARQQLRETLTSVARKMFGPAFVAFQDVNLYPSFYFTPAGLVFFGNNQEDLESFYYVYHSIMTGYLISMAIDSTVQSNVVGSAYV